MFSTKDKMAEAEVTLRLAFFLLENQLATSSVRVSIDGASVRTAGKVHFPISEFIQTQGWSATGQLTSFQGMYTKQRISGQIEINSEPGMSDLVCTLRTGKRLRVECKKGPLVPKKGNPEYVLLREALGQLLTVSELRENDLLAVAVPSSPKFEELAERWRSAPMVKTLGLSILTVSSNGKVSGLEKVM